MHPFFAQLASRLAAPFQNESRRGSKVWQCSCGQAIFFPNTQCLACKAALGYVPERGRVVALEAADGGWHIQGEPEAGTWRRCANLNTPALCNWLLGTGEADDFCIACRLNRTIPDLSIAENGERWRKMEIAKHRLVAQLVALGLPVVPKSQDEQRGLAFDFIGVDIEGNPPMTGHANGLITLNIEEADDAHREQMRVQLHEPYRTLLGHFRHEVGHYYWDRLVADSEWLEGFRQLFGDERQSYADALDRHYREGPAPDWPQRCVSAYATMHPWEDWAETWAHYLHMVDAVDTAWGFGMHADNLELDFQPFPLEALSDPGDPDGPAFLAFINAWIELAGMLNELSRAMGQQDFYPFVLPAPAIAKLHFIHRVIQDAGGKAREALQL